jgi:hypothetical protein
VASGTAVFVVGNCLATKSAKRHKKFLWSFVFFVALNDRRRDIVRGLCGRNQTEQEITEIADISRFASEEGLATFQRPRPSPSLRACHPSTWDRLELQCVRGFYPRQNFDKLSRASRGLSAWRAMSAGPGMSERSCDALDVAVGELVGAAVTVAQLDG